ncbi:UDP-N-acetylmuramoyl-L-alanyl-D-glutamate--2,6-diaminopimelate ligase [Moorella thermoacetica]|uniref:UDP-N-acetylmuramoyl-L-alanyl-D-glutamate--2,6-diaminopimelate ligase n=1 Tax=Neomoorella thermoacetica TaxID=1525 RepID=A0AAC9HGE7_NEOTH|nr:UDP-N-acetylmuramoyl-L-alanyl-D-glutamate--2,6-diaminopimelate ligase [Moorella thermoacetica]AOQ23502.1 UDP-N-acetylmuramoyl-L-alanyl-D-glutamate--2,6-diaminopimelate ligase [Moorella thermoacetica]TYL13687.1 UDP-N-acetylmuramoyl-L-alanyl-D-glutamate--2,6-diaminopimelate ligase [Moorella thermoacetica]
MTLAELVAPLKVIARGGNQQVPLTGLHYDSRRIQSGFLFVAIKGFKTDGHLYIDAALERGAVAVVLAQERTLPPGVAWVRVDDTRLALGQLAARFYDYPSRKLRLIGVTGTNGKTTTTHLIQAILEAGGRPAGLVGTIGNRLGDRVLPAEHTTPESLDLQHLLYQMASLQARAVVMEVSSHALALHRVAGTEFDVAVFTNLTQDHLDFHHDMEDYFNCKARLFQGMDQGVKTGPKYAVINGDDPYGSRLAALTPVPVVTYGCTPGCQVRARDIHLETGGSTSLVTWPGGEAAMELRLTGRYNIYNALAALAVALQEGIDPQVAIRALGRFKGVPGRLERVDQGQPFTVVVDYAHTPDGLENVLRAARQVTRGRLLVVFGCGGDRDRGKRPLMGRAAARLSDYSIITSDNPRSEDPEAIIADILPGVREVPGASYQVLVDRRRAIAAALALARPGDMVVIAGKGHETYQIVKDKTLPFDDRQVAREELAALGYTGEGPAC